jgi:hypothetical protein
MIRQIEATQSWLEVLAYQLMKMNHLEAMEKLGGSICLLKAHSTQVFEYCARGKQNFFKK